MDHDVSRPSVARLASVIGTMIRLDFVHHQNGSVLRRLDPDPRLVVVVDHPTLSVPKDEAGRLRGSHQLAFQAQTGALLHVEIRPPWDRRVRLGDVQSNELLRKWLRLDLFAENKRSLRPLAAELRSALKLMHDSAQTSRAVIRQWPRDALTKVPCNFRCKCVFHYFKGHCAAAGQQQ